MDFSNSDKVTRRNFVKVVAGAAVYCTSFPLNDFGTTVGLQNINPLFVKNIWQLHVEHTAEPARLILPNTVLINRRSF
jgi:hypothetical protein